MSGSDPFRSELDAAHRRIETLEAEHKTRVADLERENARLRQRLIDATPSRNATGRTFGALGMIILGLSIVVGMVYARVVRAPTPVTLPIATLEPIELPLTRATSEELADPGDFDRDAVARAVAGVRIDDCANVDVRSSGHVRLTIAPTGSVTAATVDEGPYRGTPVGHCIEKRFQAARVPTFTGPSRTVGKSFLIP